MKISSKVHRAVDSLGNLLAPDVTPANEKERSQVQEVTDKSVTLAWVDQGYTGEVAEAAAKEHGIGLKVVRLSGSKTGFVLLPRRRVVERSISWKTGFRRLARDFERLPEILAGLHYTMIACIMPSKPFSTPAWWHNTV